MSTAAINALSSHLRTLDPDELAGTLAGLPDSWAKPRPRTLHQVAVRIVHGDASRVRECTLAELQVLRAVIKLSGSAPRRLHLVGEPASSGVGVERRRLQEYLSAPAEDVEEVVDRLVAAVLLWPDADLLYPHPGIPEITALRRRSGAGPSPRFTPRPEPYVRPCTDEQAQAAAQVASVAALAQVQQLLEIFSGPEAWPVRKDGGVGVDQIKRLARLLHTDLREARFWLHVLHHTGMITVKYGRLQVTGHATAWCALPPDERLARLAEAVWTMNALPLCDVPDRRRPKVLVAPLTYEAENYQASAMRTAVAQTVDGLRDGEGVQPGDRTADAVYFASPDLFERPAWDDRADALGVAAVTAAVLREAELVAILAEGRLTALGRALLHGAGDPAALAGAAGEVLPIRQTCMVLADHRAVVAGLPSQQLAALLDAVAEPSAKPGQSPVWTITPASVRGYFDARPGTTPGALIAELAAASTVPLPQTVEYLITDTARRHGQVIVTSVGALLETQDQALADELCAARDLAGLQLRRVAPTLLIAQDGVAQVLKVLRAAGYAPAGGPGGQATVARNPVRAAPLLRDPDQIPTPQGRARLGREPVAVRRDHEAWARRLSAAEPVLGALAARIADAAPHLGRLDAVTLAAAIEGGGAVSVEFPGYDNPTTLIIRSPRLQDATLVGEVAARRRDVLPLPLARILLVLPSAASV